MFTLKRAIRFYLGFIGISFLVGCGFQLKGYSTSNLDRVSIFILDNTEASSMVATLRSELQKSGARLDSLTESVIQLNVLREALKRRVLTRNPTGRAAEYQLQLNVEMQLSRASSEPVSEIFRASRDYRYDNTQLLASHERENQLIDQMRVEIASSIAAYVSQVSKSANGI